MTSQILTQNNPARNGQPTPQNTIGLLATFDDLLQHGDLTAAALVLGDVWLILDAAARDNITATLKAGTNGTTAKLWAKFDDLNLHGDFDAAALCLGDLWQLLPPWLRAMVGAAIKLAVQVQNES